MNPKDFAIKHHGNQMYGNEPYIYHLDKVVALLPIRLHTIGYLHDIVEDTDVTIADLRHHFGNTVAANVYLLTDKDGYNRTIRKVKTYKVMQLSVGLDAALYVKVADRLANVQACYDFKNDRLLSMYQAEHSMFKKSVYRVGLCDDLWLRLNSLLEVVDV